MKWSIAAVALLFLVSACTFWASNAENAEAEDALTVNDEGDEQIVRQERAAKGRGNKGRGASQGGNNRGDCKYNKGPWSECNPSTRQKVRTLQLKKDGGSCEPTKQEAKPCKNSKLCRYSRGNWSDCNPDTLSMERVDTLKPGMEASCEATRKKVKKCKACQYDRQATWTECDPQTDKRSKEQKLVLGDPNRCEPNKIQTRSCKRPDGKERCFFGPWMEWGRCNQKFQTKTRAVLSGGKKCQRKAIKTRKCNDHQS